MLQYIVTCEHGGNDVPAEFAGLFRGNGATQWIESHRGYDPGALVAAQQFAGALQAELIFSTTTRLLVELNRSIRSEALFSKFTRTLPEIQKQKILDQHYHPYRDRVRLAIETALHNGNTAVHLSLHTFTPRMAGRWRPIDIGLLFDPSAKGETGFCHRWRQWHAAKYPRRRVYLNQPYAGKDDGLTTALRMRFQAHHYFGIEIEINNRFYKRSADSQRQVVDELIETIE